MTDTFRPKPNNNRFLTWLGVQLLKLLGWKPVGAHPSHPKAILVGAPHTSNWDLVIGFAAMLAFNARVFWMGKTAIFNHPLGWAFKLAGGIPIDRSARHNVVEQMVAQFAQHERLLVGITPEGTRSRVDYWKSGFYHIAYRAGLPIYLVVLDYGRKEIGFGPHFMPGGDLEADIEIIRAFYADKTAKFPHQFGPIRFRPKTVEPGLKEGRPDDTGPEPTEEAGGQPPL